MQLGQGFHDDSNEWQVKHGDPGLDLRVGVTWVRVMAGQEVVYHTDDLLMQTKHPDRERERQTNDQLCG